MFFIINPGNSIIYHSENEKDIKDIAGNYAIFKADSLEILLKEETWINHGLCDLN